MRFIPSLLNRGLGAALLVLVGVLSARATEVVGVVSDAKSQALLPGASVVIVENGRTVVADEQGRFRFTNIAAGNYTLRTSFLGYESTSSAIAVPDSGVLNVPIKMGDQVLQLEKLVVEGYREGRAKALQQKRTSQSLVDIVSSDSIGNLPDRNVADALSRLPGISIVADNGEGRFVTIRGAEANLNAVTLNGATIAAPGVDGRSGRSMPLDVISSSQISQIEVVKTITPDMDGTGIGGAINIRSASAFDRPTRFIGGSLAMGYSDLANDRIYEADASFSDRFGANKTVGVALAGSFSRRPFRTEAIQSDWSVRTANNVSVIAPDSIQILPEDAVRERTGFNANLEYRPSSSLQLYLHTIFNEFDEENYRQEVSNGQNGNLTILSDHSVVWGRARSERRAFYNPRNQKLFNVTGGAVIHRGNLTITPELTYSFAQEEQNSGFNTGQF
nr:carboxypeptidase-like regulatory domain-containing protein [Opitutaceae bacterium]